MRIDRLDFSISQENHFQQQKKTLRELMSSKVIYKKNIKELFFNPEKITPFVLENMWFLMQEKEGFENINFISNYIQERKTFWKRWHRALRNSEVPIKLLWSKNDTISLPLIADFMATQIPKNELLWLENCGHLPMLEKPMELIDFILK